MENPLPIPAAALDEISPQIPDTLRVLPMRETVVFPGMLLHWFVQRESSVLLVRDAAAKGERIIACSLMKDPAVENPGYRDVYPVGTAVFIRALLEQPEGIRLILQGLKRIDLGEPLQETPYPIARVKIRETIYPESQLEQVELEALKRTLADQFRRAVQLSPNLPDELLGVLDRIRDPEELGDLIAAQISFDSKEKQEILAETRLMERLRRLLGVLIREIQMLELQAEIQSRVTKEMGKAQREYYLREQLKAIQRELGEVDEQTAEIEELRERIEKAGMPEEARKEAERELERLKRMPMGAAEYPVIRNYLEWLVSLPWQVSTEDRLEIDEVRRVLDEDHYGLEKVKERIVEYFAVRQLRGTEMRQPILCFVGPPGVGKTSLGRSIARALGRRFVRFSLGGIRDEAEIRGHRRTYVGALPGQIIQGIRRAGVNNPVFMLDEIDKVGMDFRGDPTSALLEVLDPEQNHSFRDHYLDVPFDLSKVLFITTANLIDPIPPPLRDRMEIIEISGYTEHEKVEIARRHLIPRQRAEHGLTEEDIEFTEEGLRFLIRGYTREAGVRNLERQIAAICRKTVLQRLEKPSEKFLVTPEVIRELLGNPRFELEEVVNRVEQPGVALGLAWTPFGGEVIVVEAALIPTAEGGRGQLLLTGMLGDVMRESGQTALSWVRGHSGELGISGEEFARKGVHIHVPAGAVPKDGPSAGVTMVCALVSAATGRKARPDTAMTGEITLSGWVLPVGGIKEKVLAAHRVGLKRVILPERNQKDVEEEVPEEVRRGMEFIYVRMIPEALEEALRPSLELETVKG